MKRGVTSSMAPGAIGPYSHAVLCGEFLFVSGQIPVNAETGRMPDSIAEQAGVVLGNIEFILNEAGFSRADVVKTTIFLADLADFEAVNAVYADFFAGCVFPARSTVQVTRLPRDARIEIEAVACKGS
ncbi:MAG: Rid family detoxifying hydrolase [Spirochaetales bacterium]|nr:Rid family detoxifying hydrolase [Spirochaetales bacterium]